MRSNKELLKRLLEDKVEALEEIRGLLGFSREQLNMFLALLEKAHDGHLRFSFGNIDVEFYAFAADEESSPEVSVEVRMRGREVTHTVEYQLRRPHCTSSRHGLSRDLE